MTTPLELSNALAAAVEKAGQATVTVDARGRQPASGLLWSATEILTADHVLQRDDNIRITLADGAEHTAAIVGRDPASDLALLKVEGANFTPPELSDDVKVGHLVYALGRPADLQATLGSVVSVGGPVRGHHRRLEAYIQSDVAMYPGFSGGPLMDAAGRVLGLNSSAIARGASIALPVSVLRSVADALRRDGRVKRGFLGISSQIVRLAETLAKSLDQETGLMIIGLEKDGPAEQGGLLQGDVLVALNGHAVTDLESLQDALSPDTVGHTKTAKVVRGGEVKEIAVIIGVRE
jgi:S1-C subfamily serine protease